MGLNLVHLVPNKSPEGTESVDYNWTGWFYVLSLLKKWGVNTDEFRRTNGTGSISAEKCFQVAEAIETHFAELNDEDKLFLQYHAAQWRRLANAGGCEQR